MDVLGNISGLFETLIFIISFMVVPITKLFFAVEMINQVFTVQS
jgi:hypothetical protein